MFFKKLRDRITTTEFVLEALLDVLIDKKVVTRTELQNRILKNAQVEGIHINRGEGFTHHPEDDCDPRNYEGR